MFLSIIIVAYNSNDVLRDCLDSIEANNPFQHRLEVIVVDNQPESGPEVMLRERNDSFVLRYVAAPRNGGFGYGNNIGARMATARNLLFLNPDTLLLNPDTLSETVCRLDADRDAVIGYTLVDTRGRKGDSYSYFFELYALFPLFNILKRVSFYAVNHVGYLRRRAWPWGAAFSVSKEMFEEAGEFDEKIFLCNEEPDLMKRMPRRKLRILHHRIVHLEGHGRVVSVARYLASFRSLNYYFAKYHLSSARGYWRYLSLKLKVKRLLGRGGGNLSEAYFTFIKEREENLNA